MRILLVVLLVVGLFGLVAVAPAAREPQALAQGGGGLTVVSEEAISDRLTEFVLDSPAMEGPTGVRVIVPPGYDPADDLDLPVLYLLHGCCDDFRSWTDETDVEAFTADLDVVVVMPDGGFAGFYSDWFNNGAGGTPRWESYHIGELIPWVEATYDVLPERAGRIIDGLSMGGHGAFAYAARHPDLFVSAAAFSPAVDTNTEAGIAASEGLPLGDGGGPGSIWGQRAAEEVRWRGHNPWDLAQNLSTLDLWLITGDGTDPDTGLPADALETGVHEMAVNVHDRLDELGIPHYFDDYGPGTHTWDFWQADLHTTLATQLDRARASRGVEVRSFDVTAIEPTFSVFGWTVELDRPALAFARLGPVDAGGSLLEGFVLEGNGPATVTTAGWYVPGTSYEVTVSSADDGGASGSGAVVVADAEGRLVLPIDLGPANPVQAFTPAAAGLNPSPVRQQVTIVPSGPRRTVERLSGPSRVSTAVAVSQHGRTGSTMVVLARADDHADALTGAPLAVALDAPLLVTGRTTLDPAVAAEITQLGATTAVLLGGAAALSEQVAQDLADLGVDVERVEGSNRYATAAAVAGRLAEVTGGPAAHAMVTSGTAFADALSASATAAADGQPILLVERDRVPAETTAALGEAAVTIVGGEAAVDSAVASQLAEGGRVVDRLAGATRYETSAAVATAALDDGRDPGVAWVATGTDFPDALVAGAAAGAEGALLLLVDGLDLDGSPATRDLLAGLGARTQTLRLVGGVSVISEATAAALSVLAPR